MTWILGNYLSYLPPKENVFLNVFFIPWSCQRGPLPRPSVPACAGHVDIYTLCLCP